MSQDPLFQGIRMAAWVSIFLGVLTFFGTLIVGGTMTGGSAGMFALLNIGTIGEFAYRILRRQEAKISEIESKYKALLQTDPSTTPAMSVQQ
jgi:hypothetical protein